MDAMIQVIHVSKYYDRRPALSDVTLEIEKGEFVLLMGPSGAGKSTLLRMLIAAERPDDGQIFVQGKNVAKLKSSEVPYLRRKVGTVFQDFRLLPKKTVFDNVALPLLVLARDPGRGRFERVAPPGEERGFFAAFAELGRSLESLAAWRRRVS